MKEALPVKMGQCCKSSANRREVYRAVGGSGNDVCGKGVTFAEQDNVAKVVGVCGKDVCTVLQALSN